MAGLFVSADTIKIGDFEKQSTEAIEEFNKIMEEFKRINRELLDSWKGAGADAYKYETDNILEKIESLDNVLNAINGSAVKDIRKSYSDLDEELGKKNREQITKEGE